MIMVRPWVSDDDALLDMHNLPSSFVSRFSEMNHNAL